MNLADVLEMSIKQVAIYTQEGRNQLMKDLDNGALVTIALDRLETLIDFIPDEEIRYKREALDAITILLSRKSFSEIKNLKE